MLSHRADSWCTFFLTWLNLINRLYFEQLKCFSEVFLFSTCPVALFSAPWISLLCTCPKQVCIVYFSFNDGLPAPPYRTTRCHQLQKNQETGDLPDKHATRDKIGLSNTLIITSDVMCWSYLQVSVFKALILTVRVGPLWPDRWAFSTEARRVWERGGGTWTCHALEPFCPPKKENFWKSWHEVNSLCFFTS